MITVDHARRRTDDDGSSSSQRVKVELIWKILDKLRHRSNVVILIARLTIKIKHAIKSGYKKNRQKKS